MKMPEKKHPLQTLRKEVDLIDRRILSLLNERSRIVLKIGEEKKQSRVQILDLAREKKHLTDLQKWNDGPFPDHAISSVFREIMSASRALQSPLKVAFLGPEGTFSHEAALKSFGESTEFVPQSSIAEVFREVEKGQACYGVVPIENSTEGEVGATLDCFMDTSLVATEEIILPIRHHLMSRSTKLSDIRQVLSHPQPLAQCRQWLEKNLPGLPVLQTESTAMAARKAAENGSFAAIGSEAAAELYHLHLLKREIQDSAMNQTRFLVIGHEQAAPTKKDKTSLILSMRDEPGTLFRVLQPFHQLHLNLSKIVSRPIKKKAWQYVFFLDLEGHVSDKKVVRVLKKLESLCLFVKVIGSYPRG